jgi:hypothetical protein
MLSCRQVFETVNIRRVYKILTLFCMVVKPFFNLSEVHAHWILVGNHLENREQFHQHFSHMKFSRRWCQSSSGLWRRVDSQVDANVLEEHAVSSAVFNPEHGGSIFLWNAGIYLRVHMASTQKKKIAVFWVVAPCSLVEIYQRFRGPCCLHHQGDE